MNNDNHYIKWYQEHHKPHIKTKREYVANDIKHHKLPVITPRKEERIKMTSIEKVQRKIERNLEKIKIRQQAWHEQNKSASIINENTIFDTQGQETNGNVC
jgi:ribosome-associated translation inhibitor RaiA|tara:strand:+ start:395 stop:697 length:303 start_codon:yes stop_codon:yes gene_type:complete